MVKTEYKKWLYWGAVVLIGVIIFVVGFAISRNKKEQSDSNITNNKSAVPELPTY